MRKTKKLLFAAFLAVAVSLIFCLPVFAAISESDVQAQVDAAGKEAVTGNILVWFLCAVSFLKVSQKIDSFMASLGVNVGHTGGNMLAEAMIATRGISSARNFSSRYFGGGHSSNSTHVNSGGGNPGGGGAKPGGGFMAGGLAGVVSRKITGSAIQTATSRNAPKTAGGPGAVLSGASGGIGGHIYSTSVSRGGDFANNIISNIATGNISAMGSMTGEKAAEGLSSYMGYTALGEGAQHVPSFSNVEIGGGRITGTEVSEGHPKGISFGMYHTDQYTAPTGAYTTVHAVDGTSWYKQYAADSVEKSPYMAPNGSIAYNESIVKKLPPAPRRKDKI